MLKVRTAYKSVTQSIIMWLSYLVTSGDIKVKLKSHGVPDVSDYIGVQPKSGCRGYEF